MKTFSRILVCGLLFALCVSWHESAEAQRRSNVLRGKVYAVRVTLAASPQGTLQAKLAWDYDPQLIPLVGKWRVRMYDRQANILAGPFDTANGAVPTDATPFVVPAQFGQVMWGVAAVDKTDGEGDELRFLDFLRLPKPTNPRRVP